MKKSAPKRILGRKLARTLDEKQVTQIQGGSPEIATWTLREPPDRDR